MKKIIIILFMLFFIIPINAYAKENVVSDDYSNVDYLPNRKSFNYLELKIDDYTKEKIFFYNNLLSKNMKYGFNYIEFETEISFYSDDGELLKNESLTIIYNITDSKITNVRLEINSVAIIELYCRNSYTFTTNEYFDVREYNPDYKLAVIDSFFTSSYNAISYIGDFQPDIFIAMTYEYSDSKDVYIPMFSDLEVDEIVNEVGLEDDYDNRLLSFDIVESDYVSNSNIADYKVKIRGYNNESKVIFKWIYIHVIDISNLARSKNFEISYSNRIDDSEIIEGLELKKDYVGIKISTEYHYGFKKTGKYRYIANILFDDINLYLPGFIEVYDHDKPYALKAKEIITVSNKECLNKDEILKNFVIYDEHDGTIPNSKIDLIGLINYLSGYSILKDYEITLKAKDNIENEFTYNFIIRVTDKDFNDVIERYYIPDYEVKNEENNNVIEEAKEEVYNPVISNSNYVIRAYTTHKLTASEIQDLLISEGFLNNNDNVIIESDYFTDSNFKASSYSLSVTYENGDVTYYEINLVEKEEEKKEEESNTGLIVAIVVGSIAAIAAIIIIIMRVYVHVKKN